ncbi:MAG: Bax inhibitor-1 family protein [Bacilli bacterium]|nr:Bax inhibitor-1 family protein [Bacilli bacterium]
MSEYKNWSKDYVEETEINFSLVKVFGYMFAGLLITTIVMFGLSALYTHLFSVGNGFIDSEIDFSNNVAVLSLLIAMIVSFIGLIVLSFVVPSMLHRGKHSILVPSILYSVLMGVALSTLAIFIPWYLLGVTFGITAVIFGLLALIALLSRGRLNGLLIVGMGLILGAALISLFLWILTFFIEVTWLFWVVSLAVFAGMMLITIWDVARIKNIAQEGEMNNNLSLYCAYILYNDFIHIFIRVLRILLIVVIRTKK